MYKQPLIAVGQPQSPRPPVGEARHARAFAALLIESQPEISRARKVFVIGDKMINVAYPAGAQACVAMEEQQPIVLCVRRAGGELSAPTGARFDHPGAPGFRNGSCGVV